MEKFALQMFDATIKYSGETIFIKPLCDYFKIEYDNQIRRINSDPILATSAGKNPSMLLFGDERPRVTLTKRGFVRWVQLLNPQIVHVNLRDNLRGYQVMIFDFLFKSAEQRNDIQEKNIRLIELRSQYSVIGNEIQTLQRELIDYVNAELGLNISTAKNIKKIPAATNARD